MKYTTVPVDPMMERRRSSRMSVRRKAVRVARDPTLRMSTSMLELSHCMNFLLVRILTIDCCWTALEVAVALVIVASVDND